MIHRSSVQSNWQSGKHDTHETKFSLSENFQSGEERHNCKN